MAVKLVPMMNSLFLLFLLSPTMSMTFENKRTDKRHFGKLLDEQHLENILWHLYHFHG